MEESNFEKAVEKTLFVSRWLLTPFYIGLVLAIVFLLVKFWQEFLHMSLHVSSMPESDIIIGVLRLIDLALVGNLLIIVAFVGYDQFISRLGSPDKKDHPGWLDKIDYTGLKIKAMGSIAAIAAIRLLRVFMDVTKYSETEIFWMLIIFISIPVTGVLLAFMDRIAHQTRDI